MTGSTVFTSNRTQAARLPKVVAFPDDVHGVDIVITNKVKEFVRMPGIRVENWL